MSLCKQHHARQHAHHPCPHCGARNEQPCQLDDDDELPPVIGEAIRDTTYDIHRRALCGPED